MKRKKEIKKENLSRKVEVDVSGQIGDTKDTVFAFSNGRKCSIFIHGKAKRQLKNYFKENKLKLNFYFHFYIAGLVILLASNLKNIDEIVLDLELYGQNAQVKDALISKLKALGVSKSLSVNFKSVGKKSPAHELAYQVYIKEKLPDKKIIFGDLIKVIAKNKDREFSRT